MGKVTLWRIASTCRYVLIMLFLRQHESVDLEIGPELLMGESCACSVKICVNHRNSVFSTPSKLRVY